VWLPSPWRSLSVLLVVARFAEDRFGAAGSPAAISAAGLADAHAGALTAASLASARVLSVGTATVAALSVLAVNTVVKVVLAWTAGVRRIAGRYAALMIVPVAAVAVAAGATLTLA